MNNLHDRIPLNRINNTVRQITPEPPTPPPRPSDLFNLKVSDGECPSLKYVDNCREGQCELMSVAYFDSASSAA